jgi:hypothetical protein
MPAKQQPLGTCDLCLGPIPPDLGNYTSKGRPRLYRDCQNTANSRAGSPERSRKAKQRVERGQWQNPHQANPPTGEEQSRRATLARQREVEAGRWRNPALTDEARAKLSRPRKHTGPLHQAIEKLKRGLKMADLTLEERQAYREYQADLREARRDEINEKARRRYQQRRAR